jgi:TP901 family phage tail tape measure protein
MANMDMLESLNTQLRFLARDIPVAFADITQIASLGAQLGIASGDLAGFASTVAQFSAVTNVTVDSAATSFGALGQLLDVSSDKYQNLGSAIAQVGVNSIATESEILSVSTQIGGVASSAGLSAEYVIGLSGALASLRIPAEQSRGALTRVFQEINRAASEGGPAIQNFANVLGVSTEEASNLAKTDVESFFSQFISGLSRLDNTNLTTTLDNLGLSELRVTNTLTRLSRNTDLLAQTQGDASEAFEDGTFLAAAYALRVEDLAAKLTILQNSVTELIATFGEAILPVVGPIVDYISGLIQSITDALSQESGKWTSGILVGSAFVVGALLTIISTVALVTASLFALQTAIKGLGWTAASGGAKGLAASLWGVGAASAGATKGVAAMSFALKALPIIAIVGGLVALMMAMDEASKSADVAFSKYVGDTTGLADAIRADTDAFKALDAAGKAAAAGGIAEVTYAGTSLNEKYGEAAERVYYTAQVLGKDVPDAAYGASSAIEYNTRILGENTTAWLENKLMQDETFQALAGSSEFAEAWTAIGADLSEAIRRGASGGQDAVNDYFVGLAVEAVNKGNITIEQLRVVDAAIAQQVESINQTISGVGAGGAKTNKYGFTGRGGLVPAKPGAVNETSKIIQGYVNQASILDITVDDAADSNNEFAESFDNAGKSAGGAAKKIYLLTDYANDLSSIWDRAFDIRFSGGETLDKISKAFSDIAKSTAEAREEINELTADIQSLEADRALQEYFLSVATAYGDTLKAQEIRANLAKIDVDLTKKTQSLQKAQDKTNKTLVGSSDAAIENRSEILGLVKSYQDHVKALAASGMKQDELRQKTAQLKADFMAQATQLGYNVDELGQYATAFDDVTAAINTVPRDLTVDFNGDPALTAIEEFMAKAQSRLAGGGTFPVKVVSSEKKRLRIDPSDVRLYLQALRLGKMSAEQYDRAVWEYYSEGGYTGAGGKYEVAGIVHRGEYVVPKAEVNQSTGMPYFMEQPRMFSQGGSTGQAGPSMVMLSPEDRAILRNAGGSGNVVLYADGKELARAVNDGNRQIVAQGGRP